MRGWLISLYPNQWREQYGDEYEALLEDTNLSPIVILDIARGACLERLRVHQRIILSCLAITLYTLFGCVCLHLGLTANWPLWAPTRPARAVGLLITLMPLAFMVQQWLPPVYQSLRQRHKPARALLNFMLILPVSLTTIIFAAWTGGSLIISMGLLPFSLRSLPPSQPPEVHAWGDLHIVGLTVARLAFVFLVVPLGLLTLKLLIALQQRLLERLAA